MATTHPHGEKKIHTLKEQIANAQEKHQQFYTDYEMYRTMENNLNDAYLDTAQEDLPASFFTEKRYIESRKIASDVVAQEWATQARALHRIDWNL